MSEWKLKSLKDLSVSITSGLTPLKNNSEYWDNPVIPWLKTDQLGEKYIWDTNTKISEIALEKTSLKLYPPKTLSIAMYGEGKTRGNISIIMKPMATNQACCNIIINDEKADFEYVYYYMKTQYESLRGLSSGVRNNLNANDIKNYEIRIPESIVEQNNISKVLSVLDQKIAINNQINEELEAMAKTLYDYWFVQFDFPDENGKPYKSSGGKMVYNEQLKREIPEGWGVEVISNILDKVPNSNKIVREEYLDFGTIPVIDQSREFICGYTEDQNSILTPNDGHIVFGDHTRIVKYINFEYARGADGTQIIISKNENVPTVLLYQFISSIDLSNYGYARHYKFLKEKLILVPNINISRKYSENAETIFNRIRQTIFENQELTQLRDWLLPMLMNGQVRVEQGE